jgi:PhzF family phenazine biosynthesis protein
MKLPIYQVDAFTRRLFAGNPAAVVLLDAWLPDATLTAIAAENNLAETAFVIPQGEVMPLRWFTPTVEVDLCGHATLAAAQVLFSHLRPAAKQLLFNTRSGALTVTREDERLSMNFPSRPGKPFAITDALVRTLGMRPEEAYLARDLMVILKSESDVRDFQPDYQQLATIDAFATIISAPGDEVDYVYRFFAPRQGIPEDPVTGSANCTLVPYWAARLGKAQLTAKQLSARGGELHCTLLGDRVAMAGYAVEYLHGEIVVAT